MVQIKPALGMLGAIMALVAVGLVVLGVVAIFGVERVADEDVGFVTGPSHLFVTAEHAIATQDLTLGAANPGDFFPRDVVLRVTVEPQDPDRAVFLGVAGTGELANYLSGVSHARITRLGSVSNDVSYRIQDGARTPRPPTEVDIWAASTQGHGPRTLLWEPEPGSWGLVFMNVDAAPGVAGTATTSVRLVLLPPVGRWLVVGGVVIGVLSVVAMAFGRRGPRRGPDDAAPRGPAPDGPARRRAPAAARASPARPEG